MKYHSKWYGELNVSHSSITSRWIGQLQRKRKQICRSTYKKIQDTYKWDDLGIKTLQIIDKEKQQVQDEEMNNLEKYMKYIQASIKTIPFYLPSYYKTIQPQEEYDK